MRTQTRGTIRARLGLAGVTAALVFSFPGVVPTSEAYALEVSGKEEELPAIENAPVNIPNFGTTTVSGRPVAVVISGGDRGRLNVIDLTTHQRVGNSSPVAPEGVDVQPWGYATLPNGEVLVAGGGAQLYQVNAQKHVSDQKSGAVKQLSGPGNKSFIEAQKTAKATAFWDIVLGDNGIAYLASQSGSADGHVLSYNTRTGEWRDLGVVQKGEQAVRSIAYENGTIYAGTESQNPSIYRVKPGGKPQKIALPSDVAGKTSSIVNLAVRGGYLYVGADPKAGQARPCGGTCVLNIASGAWVDSLATWSSKIVTRPGEPTKVYYYVQEGGKGTLQEYDPKTKKRNQVFVQAGMASRLSPQSWATRDVFVSGEMNSGNMTSYNARTRTATQVSPELIQSPPRNIQTMALGPDGKIYASWYMVAPYMLSIETGPTVKYGKLDTTTHQAEGIGASGNWLITGLYPGGKVASHNVVAKGSNREPVAIGKGQDRPYVVTAIDKDWVAIGSVPSNGKLGGALSFYNVSSNRIEKKYVFPLNEITDASKKRVTSLSNLSPSSMAYRNGKLYVGTSVRGGVDAKPTASEAKIFEFDTKKDVVTKVITPVKGQRAVTALTFSPDGKLYGSTGEYVFEVNPADLSIKNPTKLNFAFNGVNRSQLHYRQGVLYGIFGGKLFAIPATSFGQYQRIADYLVLPNQTKIHILGLTLGSDGNLYYARGAKLYRYRF